MHLALRGVPGPHQDSSPATRYKRHTEKLEDCP
jgi:hypothetical protein